MIRGGSNRWGRKRPHTPLPRRGLSTVTPIVYRDPHCLPRPPLSTVTPIVYRDPTVHYVRVLTVTYCLPCLTYLSLEWVMSVKPFML